MANYFTSDWHLGHRVITKYRPQFKTIEEHDDAIFAEAEKLITYALKIKGMEKSTLGFYRAMISERRGSLKNALHFLKEAEKFCFTQCSLDLVQERRKFIKAKMPMKTSKNKKETK